MSGEGDQLTFGQMIDLADARAIDRWGGVGPCRDFTIDLVRDERGAPPAELT